MTITVGIDIGSGVVKTPLFKKEGGKNIWKPVYSRFHRLSRSKPWNPPRLYSWRP